MHEDQREPADIVRVALMQYAPIEEDEADEALDALDQLVAERDRLREALRRHSEDPLIVRTEGREWCTSCGQRHPCSADHALSTQEPRRQVITHERTDTPRETCPTCDHYEPQLLVDWLGRVTETRCYDRYHRSRP
jgi:hypothetical protein